MPPQPVFSRYQHEDVSNIWCQQLLMTCCLVGLAPLKTTKLQGWATEAQWQDSKESPARNIFEQTHIKWDRSPSGCTTYPPFAGFVTIHKLSSGGMTIKRKFSSPKTRFSSAAIFCQPANLSKQQLFRIAHTETKAIFQPAPDSSHPIKCWGTVSKSLDTHTGQLQQIFLLLLLIFYSLTQDALHTVISFPSFSTSFP